MPSIELDIPHLPPTPNQTRGMHWAKHKKIRDTIGIDVHLVWFAVKPREWDHKGKPAILDATICAHGVAGDEDNAWARLKPLIDGLVAAGALVDDSPRWLTLGTISHAKAPPRKGHVVVRITYPDKQTPYLDQYTIGTINEDELSGKRKTT